MASISIDKNIKSQLEAMSPQEFDTLKQTTMYYRLVRSLRASGWSNLVWGGLTLLWGLSALSFAANIFSAIQAILGFLIVAQSLWSIVRPGVKNFLALMAILLFCGLWNIFISVVGRIDPFSILITILGLFQLWWAYQSYNAYQLFSQSAISKPTRELSKQYDDIWGALAHPSPALSPELLSFQLGRNRYWWWAMLLPDHAVIAHKRQKVLLIFSKSDLVLFPTNPKAFSRDFIPIFAMFNKEVSRGKIYPASFHQYLNWKGLENSEAQETVLLGRTRLIYQVIRLILIIAALLIMFSCATSINIATQLPRFPR